MKHIGKVSGCVIVFGVFDRLHSGHRAFLGQAKRHGKEVIAVLARDSAVMSEAERQKVERDLLGRKRDLRRAQDDFREDLNVRRNEEIGKLLAVVQKTIEAFKGIDLSTAPELLGYVATKSKSTAEVVLETPGKRPLLARWQYALGKSAIFTSDVKDRWAADWLKWKNYSKFWAQLVRETMRRRENDEFDLQVVRDGDRAAITINAVEKDGRFRNLLHPKLRIIDPAQSASTVEVPQVGPGSYEMHVPLPQDGTYVFRAIGEGSGGPSRTLEYSYPDEYHFYPPDFQTLRAISAETGGVYQPAGPEIFDPGDETVDVHTRLWPPLASLALVIFIGDVFLRRLRLFE